MVLMDGSGIIYIFIGCQLFAATVILALPLRSAAPQPPAGVNVPTENARGRSLIPFFLPLALTLFFLRWPGVTSREFFNQDESVLVAGALTLKHDPAFWRSVQSTTSGPLNYYPLLVPALFGLPLDYATARIIGLSLLLASLALTYLSFRRLFPESVARMSVLPAWAFLSCCSYWDYVHYSSEHVSILLLCAALYFAVRLLGADSGWEIRNSAAAGILLGCVPFAKLQAVPAASVLAILIAIRLIGKWIGEPGWGHLRSLTTFSIAGLVPSGVVLLSVYSLGIAKEFWTTYVLWNLNHTSRSEVDLAKQSLRLFMTIFFGTEFDLFARGAMAAALLMIVLWYLGGIAARSRSQPPLSLPKSYLAAGSLFLLLPLPLLYSILITGNVGKHAFAHYLLLLVFPITGVLGWLLGMALAAISGGTRFDRVGRVALWSGYVALAVLPPLVPRIVSPGHNPHLRPAPYYQGAPGSAISRLILSYTTGDQPLAVWGWAPHLHVETQLRQATTFANSEREIEGFQQASFRARYLKDMQEHRPPVFVDETGLASTTYKDRARFGHESFPELRELIRSRYEFLGEFNGMRVYHLSELRRPSLRF